MYIILSIILLSSMHLNFNNKTTSHFEFNCCCYKAVWALGNIAGDSTEYRDMVLAHGALWHVLAQFQKNVTISMIRTAAWTLSNFSSGKPQPQFHQVSRIHFII